MTARVPVLVLAVATGCAPSPDGGPTERITVPRGATLAAVAETLQERNIIHSAELFRFYARVSGRQRAIQAGTYRLPRAATIHQVLDSLMVGRPDERQLVVPEGLMLHEVADIMEEQLGIPTASFFAAAADSTFLAWAGVPGPNLEGYLYPSTYYVPVGASARQVVRQMLAQFEAAWRPAWEVQFESLGLTRHELVTLASIIEGEVRHDQDRPYVASVYHNRLRRGMRLQADPTVIYTLGRRRRLFERDYQRASPYNTYLIDGLPPGPIGQPSAASIEAALYPARTDFLYLVARTDGRHVFSRTLAEHRRAVREVRQSAARSSGQRGP